MPEQKSYPEVSLADLVVPTRPITYGIVQPGPDISPEGIPLIRGKDYSSGKVDSSALYHVQPEIDAPYSRSKVRGGDILFSIVGYVGQSALVPDDLAGANITQTTARISIAETKADSRYVYQHLSAEHFRPQIKRFEKGSAQPGLNLSDVARLKISLPEPAVQSRIAEILSTVDEAIEQTETLIKKTQQIKAGLMHDLFTRGVTPDGQLRPPREEAPQLYKESPIGWIPKEWGTPQIGEVLSVNVGYVGPVEEHFVEEGEGIPLLSTTNIGSEGFTGSMAHHVSADFNARNKKSRVNPGDLLVARHGKSGQAAMVPSTIPEAQCLNVVVIRTGIGLSAHYMAQLLLDIATRNRLMRHNVGSVQGVVNTKAISNFAVPQPEEKEQDRIVDILGSADCRIEDERGSQRMLENIKQGLTHDLLTGRVPVRLATGSDV